MTKPIKGVYQKKAYWYVRVNGKEIYCGKGSKGRKTAEIRRKRYDVEQHEKRERRVGLKIRRNPIETVGNLVDWYLSLTTVKGLKPRTYLRKCQTCAQLKKYFGDYRVEEVEGDAQEDYREYRLSQGLTHGGINQEIVDLSAMYHLALKRKKILSEAMPGQFVKVKVNNPRRVITDAEYKALLDRATPDFVDLLICGWETAMREDEICDLKREQVHLDELHISGQKLDYIYLGVFDTKTGAERVVPVSPTLKEIFKRRMNGLDAEDYVFTRASGERFTLQSVEGRMERACKRAGIIYGDKQFNKNGERIGITFHCLRHTRISKWVEADFNLEKIRRATGHKSLDAFQRYVHLDKPGIMALVAPCENATKMRENCYKVA